MEYLFNDFGNLKFYLIGSYPDEPLSGFSLNIILAIISVTIGFAFGVIFGLGRISKRWYVRWPCIVYIDTLRSTPLIMLLFWFYFWLPAMGFSPSLFGSAAVTLSVYASAYLAEITRAGVLSISSGQMEAALSSGMSRFQAQLNVVLPHAFIKMLPTYVSFFNHLFKSTCLVFTIGIVELVHTGVIRSQIDFDKLYSSYLIVAIGFWIICYALSYGSQKLERKVSIHDYEQYKPEITKEDLSSVPLPMAVKKLFVTHR